MRTLTAAVAGAFVAASVLGGIGSAVSPDATLYACVHNRAQTIKMTTASKACPSGYTKLSWSTQGPKGDPGPNPDTYWVSAVSQLGSSGAEAYCYNGDTATGGGVEASGDQISTSSLILDGNGKAIGWRGAGFHNQRLVVTVLCIHTP